MTYQTSRFLVVAATFGLAASAAQADIVHLDDVIIDGSACVGFDCVNGESFGFDTIRLKENNVRIKFQDTSTGGSFPSVDWQLTANSSANGGLNKFSIDDIDNSRTPFTIEARAPSHSLYVDDGGRLGLGTSSPVVDAHIISGNSPTVRLDQNGSSGFAPQVWDVVGNETNFFIRDATNGSQLPFRIRPGADSNSLYIDPDNNIGMGTASPDAPLEISRTDAFVFFRLTATGAANDSADFTYTDGPGGAGEIRYNIVDGDGQEMSLNADGDLTITGELTTAGSCSIGCDRVFDEDYAMLTLDEHTDAMWAQGYLPNVGPTVEGDPFNVSDKLGRVLNELEHAHIYISQQQNEISDMKATHAAQIADLTARLSALETR